MKRALIAVAVVLLITSPIVAAQTNWSYTGESHSVSAQCTAPNGIWQSRENLNWYVACGVDNDIDVYNETWVYQSTIDTSTEGDTPREIYQNETGYWFMLSQPGPTNENFVFVYDENWVYTGVSHNISDNTVRPQALFQGNDGRWYIGDESLGEVVVYDSDFTYDNEAFDVSSEDGSIEGIYQVGNGKWYMTGDGGPGNGRVYVYNESWNYTGTSFDISAEDGFPQSIHKDPNNFWWMAGADTDSVYKYEGIVETPTPTPDPNMGLTLSVNSWMPLDDTQSYTVIWTNSSGEFDVTDTANVSSNNSSIVSVDNTTDTLVSHNITGRVNVSATWDGETSNSENVTVGKRNLTNIGIMPPEQWPCSFLGCDENPKTGDNPHNIGSPMQWLLLIIVIMVAATRFIENPWAGVGTGIIFSILVWVLGFIDLGSVLVTVFSGLLIGAMMARTQMGRGVTRDNEQSGIAATQVRNRNE